MRFPDLTVGTPTRIGLEVDLQNETYCATPLHPQAPQDAFSGLMRHQVIIFESCFPNAHIEDDAVLEECKRIYRVTSAKVDLYPRSKSFIALSIPPLSIRSCLRRRRGQPGHRAFANSLKSPDVPERALQPVFL